MRARPLRRAGLVLLVLPALAACAARLGPAPPEALSLTQVWAERRATFREVSALADVRVDAAGRGLAWPEFTAVFSYAHPDRVTVAGFTPFGQPLFTWEAEGKSYTLRTPDRERPRTGRLDGRGADPEARLLGALRHVVDAVLGPDTGGRPPGVDRAGRWVVAGPHDTVALAVAEGRVTALEVRRGGAATARLAFGGWGDAGPLPAPYRIALALPGHDVTAEILVSAWRIGADAQTAGKPAPVLTANRVSP